MTDEGEDEEEVGDEERARMEERKERKKNEIGEENIGK